MTETKAKLKIRRAPKFLPFMLTGAVLGLISAVVINAISTAPGTTSTVLGLLIGWLTGLGAAFGIIAALMADWLFRRSAKEVQATKLKK